MANIYPVKDRILQTIFFKVILRTILAMFPQVWHHITKTVFSNYFFLLFSILNSKLSMNMCIWRHKLWNDKTGVGPTFTWSNEPWYIGSQGIGEILCIRRHDKCHERWERCSCKFSELGQILSDIFFWQTNCFSDFSSTLVDCTTTVKWKSAMVESSGIADIICTDTSGGLSPSCRMFNKYSCYKKTYKFTMLNL